jgi:hypothetical protein
MISLACPMLKRPVLLSMLPKCLILLALPGPEWLLIRWLIKSYLMKGQGIDVILGMNWMKMHRVVLDISARLVHLDSPIYGKVSL